jgi:hypothetical protein
MILIDILFYIGLSVAFVHAEPLIYLKRFIGFKEEDYDTYSSHKRALHRLIHCLYCSSFWITLIVSQSFIMAVIVSVITWVLDNKL